MGEEDPAADHDQEEQRSLYDVLKGPVWDTFRACSLADLETSDGFLNILRVG